MAYSAVVLGASGFSGGEVLRILFDHPAIEVAAVSGGTRAGESLADVQPHLAGADRHELVSLDVGLGVVADVCFSCMPSGELSRRADRVACDKVVDLSDDFRAAGDKGWIYGLTELARESIGAASRISNPGCYPTASLLCLAPFARAGLIEGPLIIDAMSGVSGAGRKASDMLLFSALDANVMAYGATDHRHVREIERGLAAFGSLEAGVSFTPHLVPMARGLLVTGRARLVSGIGDEEAVMVLNDVYAGEPLVAVSEAWPQTKSVSGTARAVVSARVDNKNGYLIASCAIDNLGKGAAGQAVQNANLVLGLDETTGLTSYGVWP